MNAGMPAKRKVAMQAEVLQITRARSKNVSLVEPLKPQYHTAAVSQQGQVAGKSAIVI